ncbi:MAG: hypothetical protein C0594_17715 [Marinilabiliales bacterium]|nr:MAG: hypothetical protein C0594_17715 [Marinilabiliales bacterium]
MKSLCLIIALFSIPFSFYAQNVEWNQNYGGSGNEFFLSAQKIFSRYYCFGASTSSDHTLNGNYGGYDGWFFAINDDGNPALSFYFGGDQDDFLRDGIHANENAILMCGFTESTNGTFLGLDSYGEKDGFVQAVDSFGSEIYTKKYGGTSDDFLNKIIHTNNGGYLIAGTSKSSDNDLPGNNGQNDIWLLRLGSSMETVWSYNYGGPGYDEALDVLALDDGSFLVSGSTNSSVFST